MEREKLSSDRRVAVKRKLFSITVVRIIDEGD